MFRGSEGNFKPFFSENRAGAMGFPGDVWANSQSISIRPIPKLAAWDLSAWRVIFSRLIFSRSRRPFGTWPKYGSGFMVVADFTNLISRHVPTSKTCCRLVLICYTFVDLQRNRRFTTTMNPDPA